MITSQGDDKWKGVLGVLQSQAFLYDDDDPPRRSVDTVAPNVFRYTKLLMRGNIVVGLSEPTSFDAGPAMIRVVTGAGIGWIQFIPFVTAVNLRDR